MEAPVTAPPPTNSSTQPAPIPLRPAVAPSVQLGFTILYTSLYAGLFLVVYAQLWRLYLYRHKRWSYQSVFLFLCLLWAALRTTLFSFYFCNALEANHLPAAAYWLLYCSPVCLQFFTLSLINLYFTQVLLKVRETYSSDVDRGIWLARCMYGAMSALFFCVNVVCAALRDRGDGGPYLISKGTTVCRTAALGAAVILLFSSRACYNLTVLILSQSQRVESFNFDWYNVSDQLGDAGYLAFGAILFIWELLPTGLLILILRVRRPAQESSSMAVNNRVLPRPYFFDDPQGSDEDASMPWARASHPHASWYGSESAPLLFASKPPDQSHQHHSFYSTPQN
ncbi:Integral membrane protein GPR137B [Dissostichus eleginoides]|uniref:Integral membrane protein GPR137B n=1 Tax=Dissostichus eleginoides TaxID=100907 RepID=A0AAD9FMR8_DISEL|nr:Integral membrane protein GPR137B [Dissostichus eleginoides]